MISIIFSADERGTIGDGGKLPWHLPADLQYFKKTTLKHCVIMGRKTFESIGRPLKNRFNIVITRQDIGIDGCTVVHSLDEAFDAAKRLGTDSTETFVIGGAWIFQQAMPFATRLYVTSVKGFFPGDMFAPKIEPNIWKQIARVVKRADDQNPYDMEFVVYERGLIR